MVSGQGGSKPSSTKCPWMVSALHRTFSRLKRRIKARISWRMVGRPPFRFPAAPLEKGMPMPLEHRLGFHQLVRRLPSGPHPGHQHPQEAKRRVKPRAGLSLLADTFFVKGELTAHGYHLTSQGGSLSEEGRDEDQSIADRLPA